MKRIKIILLGLALALTGCSSQGPDLDLEEGLGGLEEEEAQDPRDLVNLDLRPNELGEIMILMYHNIGEEGEWTRTRENLLKDLNTLYDKGYRAVSITDLVNNTMDVEEGKTPVLITFDDGNRNNFNIIEEEGQLVIDSQSALGIMEDFKRARPDFNLRATFYPVGEVPFQQEEYIQEKLEFLLENGYDIGNHTIDHRSMKEASSKEYIQEGLGGQAHTIKNLVGYQMNSYALCYGERPRDKELHKYLEAGSYQGEAYRNIAILNVGWKPSLSPVHKDFDPLSLARIRASETKVDGVGLYDWLEYFDKHPEKRYISDGRKDLVTIPEELVEDLDQGALKDKVLYKY